MDIKKFKDIYLSEAEELVESITAGILNLEKNPKDKEVFDELMRYSHTMKSSAAAMGYGGVSNLMHKMEDVFDNARKEGFILASKDINTLLKAVDSLKKALVVIQKSDREPELEQIAHEVEELANRADEGSEQGEEGREGSSASIPVENERITHIKVPVERLDRLMDLTEELVIDKIKIEYFQNRYPEIKETADHLARLVTDMRYQVMQARLLPVEQIFMRFPRMVRDMAEAGNKRIDLEISGGELELDRTIVDKLGEPLVHLIRNAIDHGIEKEGKIYLKAVREKEYAVITVENNGSDIDFEKLKRIAVKNNIISQVEADSLGVRESKDLLFHPHISTRGEITETSGRGIGLNAVKDFVTQMGGRVTVESPIVDGGTRFTLELPLTLAIINALLVNIRGSVFAIPFSNIEKTVSMRRGDIMSMADQDMVIVEGRDIPIISVNTIEGQGYGKEGYAEQSIIVLVRQEEDGAGIMVDSVLNEQEIIIKPLPSILRGVRGFSGSTILGDGKTILILDIKELLEDFKK